MQSNELKMIVAKNITDMRVRAKMTQLDLGNALSYSDKAVSKWERAEAVPDVSVLMKMADIFGCTVDYLVRSHDGASPLPPLKKKTNHLTVSLIALTGVWTVAVMVFIILHLCNIFYPLIFSYSLVISLILLTVFNALWGKRLYGLFIISALVISVIFTIYLIFLWAGNNFWQINLISVPSLAIVFLCFFVKKSGQYVFEIKK